MSARKYCVWEVDCDECDELFTCADVEPDVCPGCEQPVD